MPLDQWHYPTAPADAPGRAGPHSTIAHPATCSCLAPVHEWYTTYAGMMRRYLLVRVRDPLAADECLSDTFLRAIAHREKFRCGGDGVRPWLFTIARNIAHDYVKKAWRRRETPIDDLPDGHDAAPSPEETVVTSELRDALSLCIEQLSTDQRLCVQLRFFAGLSVEQTAELMDRDRGAVRALQLRAVRKLAKLFGQAPLHDQRISQQQAA